MSDLEPVVIELSGDTKSDLNLNSEPTLGKQPSVNFGGGIELLMNEKKRSGPSQDQGLGELSELENELNDLTLDINEKSVENTRSSLFSKAINDINDKKDEVKVTLEDGAKSVNLGADTSSLGEQTSSNLNVNKTMGWVWESKSNSSSFRRSTNDKRRVSKREI